VPRAGKKRHLFWVQKTCCQCIKTVPALCLIGIFNAAHKQKIFVSFASSCENIFPSTTSYAFVLEQHITKNSRLLRAVKCCVDPDPDSDGTRGHGVFPNYTGMARATLNGLWHMLYMTGSFL
jgi:hypothetical protein